MSVILQPMLNAALLSLLQLASSTLPVGAYSYSEGLEWLVELGVIESRSTLNQWLVQELRYGAVRLEAAVMRRGYEAIAQADLDRLVYWNHWLSAARETEELRSQSWQMGRSLLRLFLDLQLETAVMLPKDLQGEGCNFGIAFAIVAAHWQIDLQAALLGYLHSWATNLLSAGIKLIPLGQTAGQQLLQSLQPQIIQAAEEIIALPDDRLDSCGWGLTIASMNHETQYSRLFRS